MPVPAHSSRSDTSVFVNGVSGLTGEPLVAGLDRRAAARLARGQPADPDLAGWLRKVWKSFTSQWLGLPLGVDPLDPGKAGWGVVFPADAPAAVREALEPLIAHRRERLGRPAVKVLDYQPGEDWRRWLSRHGAEPGSVQPHQVPYYLLLVGAPSAIPYETERLLAVEYAVGRLGFDGAEAYARYAKSLIEYETADGVPTAREAAFFAARHAGDPATQLSADQLVEPLVAGMPAGNGAPEPKGIAEQYGFASRELRAERATKANLGELFRPPSDRRPPALLFTATHGLGFPSGHPRQRAEQGALVCQDWPGPGTVAEPHYFSAADLPADARVHGLVCFHFACYGAGTPQRDAYLCESGEEPREIAEQPFVAALPNGLLSHPRGGALAVIGHVERAWGYSILGASGQPQIQPFQNALGGILLGWPVGHAVRSFRERYAVLSTELNELLKKVRWDVEVPDDPLAAAWVECNDAGNYAVLGDPAARLRVEAMRLSRVGEVR